MSLLDVTFGLQGSLAFMKPQQKKTFANIARGWHEATDIATLKLNWQRDHFSENPYLFIFKFIVLTRRLTTNPSRHFIGGLAFYFVCFG